MTAVSYSTIYPQTITNNVTTIQNADASTLKTLYTAGSNGSRIENIMVSSTDTAAAYIINVYITISATNYLIGTVNVPLNTGFAIAVPTINLLGSAGNLGVILNRDANGNTYLYLASGSTLKVASTTTVTSGKVLAFLAQGGDY